MVDNPGIPTSLPEQPKTLMQEFEAERTRARWLVGAKVVASAALCPPVIYYFSKNTFLSLCALAVCAVGGAIDVARMEIAASEQKDRVKIEQQRRNVERKSP